MRCVVSLKSGENGRLRATFSIWRPTAFPRVLLSCLAICLALPHPTLRIPYQHARIEFRWAEMNPGKKLTEAIIPKTQEKIYIHNKAILTNKDVLEAGVTRQPFRTQEVYQVDVTLVHNAAHRMTAATTGHSGLRLAMLIDGKVISAPWVQGIISDKLTISGGMTRLEAEDISNLLRQSPATKSH